MKSLTKVSLLKERERLIKVNVKSRIIIICLNYYNGSQAVLDAGWFTLQQSFIINCSAQSLLLLLLLTVSIVSRKDHSVKKRLSFIPVPKIKLIYHKNEILRIKRLMSIIAFFTKNICN